MATKTISERGLRRRINRRFLHRADKIWVIKRRNCRYRFCHSKYLGRKRWERTPFNDLEKYARKLGMLGAGETLGSTISQRTLIRRINRKFLQRWDRIGINRGGTSRCRFSHATYLRPGWFRLVNFSDLEKYARKLGMLDAGEKMARKPR